MVEILLNLWVILQLVVGFSADHSIRNPNVDLGNSEEYCITDIFQPSCFENEVIIIDAAIFGRRKFSKCLTDEKDDLNFDDPKVIGCFADVKSILDDSCSLRRFCEIRIIDLKLKTSCYSYLKYYLEVSWSCIKVAKENRQCKVSVDGGKQNLLSPTTSNPQCGNKNQPWVVETHPGQQIKVQLVPYQNKFPDNPESHLAVFFKNFFLQESCHLLGRINDKYAIKETIICLASIDDKILTDVATYISNSSSLEINLYSLEKHDKTDFKYILSLEATGCSDLIPPADAWLKRTENEATIGCYSTRLRWQLKCVGQRWIGVIGNCSKDSLTILKSDVKSTKGITKDENQIVVIAVIITVGMVLCFMIACLGVVLLKRYYALKKVKAFNQGVNIYDTRFSSTINKDVKSLSMQGTFVNDINNIDYDQKQQDPIFANGGQYYELDKSLVE